MHTIKTPHCSRWPSSILVFLSFAAVLPTAVAAQTLADSAAIRATALDYIEGWYSADAARMERALHPHLTKRIIESVADGGVRLKETSAFALVKQVRAGGGSSTPQIERRT